MKNKLKEEFHLPITEEGFETLIDFLVKKYKLPNRDHASAVVANRIMHLPPDQAMTTYDYLGNCVLKNIAFQVAQSMGSKASHKVQIGALVETLTAEPNNMQAQDALQKAANEGSTIAKLALEGLGLTLTAKPALTVVPTTEKDSVASPANGTT